MLELSTETRSCVIKLSGPLTGSSILVSCVLYVFFIPVAFSAFMSNYSNCGISGFIVLPITVKLLDIAVMFLVFTNR